MPTWNDLLNESQASGSTFDIIRRKYLRRLNKYTKRNTIIYYSGWLQKSDVKGVDVNDTDKNGLMSVIKGLDFSKGLDLILHTPGGNTAAMESIVDYLKSIFDNNIRAIVPQLAMSAGTMIALSCKSIVMGKQSSLGPIDPQYNGVPAHGIIEEFKKAKTEIAANPVMAAVWQPIIAKYNPTLIGECEKAIDWCNRMVKVWLGQNMLSGMTDKSGIADRILQEFGDHSISKSHARHISRENTKMFGVRVEELESDQRLQDLVLTVHHACRLTFENTPAYKIIENHKGTACVKQAKTLLIQQQK